MGPLDPWVPDFSEWVSAFKDAVCNRGVVPPATIEDFRGHVDLEFTVARDGTVGSVRVLKQSGRTVVDLISQRVLLASAPFLPLPAAFPDPRITMQVSFWYNENR